MSLYSALMSKVKDTSKFRKGVMFITLEDETGISNLVIWPSLFEQQRQIIFSATMMGVQGRVHREGEVVHLIALRLFDLSADLASIGEQDSAFPMVHARGDEVYHGSGPDHRTAQKTGMTKTRDIFIPDLHIDRIKVKTRDFR